MRKATVIFPVLVHKPLSSHMPSSDAKTNAGGWEALVMGPHIVQDSVKVLFNVTG